MTLCVSGCGVRLDACSLTWFQSDYYAIHRPYGTLDDVHRLISELRLRNMKLIMDLVVNHTSDQVRRSDHPLHLKLFFSPQVD
jgi:hypothetical protein